MNLIPENILIGANDEIPGMDGSKLPPNIDDASLKLKVSSLRTIYAHNIRISSMNEVEQSFSLFLKDWKMLIS
jgi:hypothetical protein